MIEQIPPADEISEVINKGFVELSLVYAAMYEKDGKNFVRCFLKYKSIRMVCEAIVTEYKKLCAFDECKKTGKDFSEYANRQMLDDKWKKVLAEILLIIYSIINNENMQKV